MSTNYPCPLAWILAVEALASFQEVAVSLLIDVVKRAPKEINGPIGDNAREMVSFRILDELWAQMRPITTATSSVLDCGVGFDLSQTCEDALQEILAESSEMVKWDLERFIEHKRSCLPKCALDKLKDAILEDHPLIPASLKEKSGLVIQKKSDGSAQRLEGNGGDVLGNSPARVSLSAKRVREESETDDFEGPSTLNQVIMDNAHVVSSNAVDKDNSCTQQAMEVQKSVSFHGNRLLEQDNENGSASAKKAKVGALEKSNVAENINYERSASKWRRRMNPAADVADLLHNQQQASRNDEEQLSPAASVDGQDKEVGCDEAKHDSEHCAEPETLNGAEQVHTKKTNSVDEVPDNSERSFPVNPPNDAYNSEAQAAMGHSCEPDIFKEDDSYIDGNICRTVSSQCTYSEFSSATEDRTEQQNCLICQKDGQLLVCSSDACPRVVHESCLGVAATFDESGCFYCPFCEYSRAISDFMKSKNKFSLARKSLASFTSLGDGSVAGNSPNGVRGIDQNQIRENEELDKFIEPGSDENVDRVAVIQSRVKTKGMQQVEPSISSDSPRGVKGRVSTEENNVHKSIKKAGTLHDAQNCEADDSMCREREQLAEIEEQWEVLPETHAVTRVKNQVCSSDTHEAQMVVKKTRLLSSREQKEQTIAPQTSQACVTHNSKCSNSKTVHENENHSAIKEDQVVLNQLQKVLRQKTVSSRRTERAESSGEKSDKSNASNHKLRVQKLEIHYTYPAVRLLRRKAIRWTDDEEQILKEGVQKFASNNSTKMPWKTILGFGKGKFHEGRTTIDLKDKWRNICKGKPVV